MINLNRAFFPSREPQVLLGRRLLPQLTVWHLHQLYGAKSPLLGLSGDAPGLGDLVVAASICVTVFPDFLRSPRGPVEIMRHHVAKWYAAREGGLLPELLMWRAYWKRSNAVPLLSHRKGSKDCDCPPALALWAALKLRGFTEAEAWNRPMARASWYKVALAESEGAEVRLMTEEKREAYLKAGKGYLLKGYE